MSKTRKNKVYFDDRFTNSKFDFCKNLKWFLIAPAAIILVGVILLCTLGFNLGIDFTGGSNMTIYIDGENYSISNLGKIEDAVQGVLTEHGLKITTVQTTEMTLKDADDNEIRSNASAVIVKYQNNNSLTTDEIKEENEHIKEELLTVFGYTSADEVNYIENGGITTASASAELMMKSFIALLVALVLVLIYVALRFEITAGLAAILALFHDLLVTGSVILMFRTQVNVAFIAALITVLGYSINNTIIIFDRMRSDVKTARNANERIDNNKIANNAVKGTMMRSLLTGITTLIMVLMITIIGVADIREFAFPILVGIIAGFYSSVFITPGLWAIAYRPRKRKKVTQKVEKKEEIVEVEPEKETATEENA